MAAWPRASVGKPGYPLRSSMSSVGSSKLVGNPGSLTAHSIPLANLLRRHVPHTLVVRLELLVFSEAVRRRGITHLVGEILLQYEGRIGRGCIDIRSHMGCEHSAIDLSAGCQACQRRLGAHGMSISVAQAHLRKTASYCCICRLSFTRMNESIY